MLATSTSSIRGSVNPKMACSRRRTKILSESEDFPWNRESWGILWQKWSDEVNISGTSRHFKAYCSLPATQDIKGILKKSICELRNESVAYTGTLQRYQKNSNILLTETQVTHTVIFSKLIQELQNEAVNTQQRYQATEHASAFTTLCSPSALTCPFNRASCADIP